MQKEIGELEDKRGNFLEICHGKKSKTTYSKRMKDTDVGRRCSYNYAFQTNYKHVTLCFYHLKHKRSQGNMSTYVKPNDA